MPRHCERKLPSLRAQTTVIASASEATQECKELFFIKPHITVVATNPEPLGCFASARNDGAYARNDGAYARNDGAYARNDEALFAMMKLCSQCRLKMHLLLQ